MNPLKYLKNLSMSLGAFVALGVVACGFVFAVAAFLRCLLFAWHKGWTLFAIIFLLAAGSAPATPVLFPLKSMFPGQAWNNTFYITPRYSLLTDGTNFYFGPPKPVSPTGGTNPIVQLRPNQYTVFFPEVRSTITLYVFDTNTVQNAVNLTTNLFSYYYTNVVIGGGGSSGGVNFSTNLPPQYDDGSLEPSYWNIVGSTPPFGGPPPADTWFRVTNSGIIYLIPGYRTLTISSP